MIDVTIKLDKEHEVWRWLVSQENKLLNAGHVGTHIDVYKQSSIPLEYFRTHGVLIDCTGYGLDEEIGINVIEEAVIESGSFVMFKTGIQDDHPYGSDPYAKRHPELSWELIDRLLEKKVHFIGIDCAGIRNGKEHVKADVKAEENGAYVIENLDLRKLKMPSDVGFEVYTMWIENPFATGLSTRVLVDVE